MAQNPYNNYIKRKAQTNVGVNPTIAPKPQSNPGVGFKKRVVGNLGSSPQVSNPKPQNTSSQTVNQFTAPTQPTPRANVSPSNDTQPINNINIPISDTNTLTPAPVATDGTPMPIDGGVTPMQVDNAPEMYQNSILSNDDMVGVQNPRMSRTTENKTAEQIALEMLEQQKAQAQKDWELKQEQIKLQQEQAKSAYEQSIAETDKKHKESVDAMNQNRYNQQEDMNVSSTRRGLAYSPQALALENVANLGHNKNLAEASKQRMDMLTQLNMKLGEMTAQIALGNQNALNEYNRSILDMQTSYNNTMMGWMKDKELTADERAWKEAQDAKEKAWREEQDRIQREWEAQQAEKDKEFQQMMDKYDKEWQTGEKDKDRDHTSSENALDRDKYKSRSGGGSGSYYSNWKNWGGRSYNGWSRNGYQGYGGLDLDLSSDIDGKAFTKTFGEMSTDTYNALRSGNELESVQTRADIYKEEFDNQIEYAKRSGASDRVISEIIAKRNTALKHLYNDAYANSTNTAYKVDAKTKEIPKRPLREDYIQSKKNTQRSDARHYQATNTLDPKKKKEAEFKRDSMAKFEGNRKHTKYGTSKSISEKMRDGSYSDKSSKSNSTSKAKDNVSKSVSKASENNKKAKENSKKNAKISVGKSKENNKKAKEKSKNNFKKSISKSVNNVKKTVKKSTDNFKKNISKKKKR